MDTLNYILEKYKPEINPKNRLVRINNLSRHTGGLTKLFYELGYTVGAEIGVEQGKYSEELCRDNPNLKLFSIDPYKTYTRYADHVSQEKLDGFYNEAVIRLKPYNCTLIRKSSLSAVKEFKPNSLDFVYIDANHEFEYVIQDIIWWAKTVRVGGIVAGHDYKSEGEEKTQIPFHVIQAVNAYTDSYKINPVFLTRRDKCPSWFFVRS